MVRWSAWVAEIAPNSISQNGLIFLKFFEFEGASALKSPRHTTG